MREKLLQKRQTEGSDIERFEPKQVQHMNAMEASTTLF
jgi:hypothetical protein